MTSDSATSPQPKPLWLHAAEHLDAVALVVDRNGVLVDCNRIFCEACELPLDALRGTPISRWLLKFADGRFPEFWAALGRTERVTFESLLTTGNGVRLEGRSGLVDGPSGDVLAVIFGDIRRAGPSPPSIDRARLEFLLSESDAGIFEWDLVDDRLVVSPAGQRLFDLKSAEHRQAAALFADLLDPDHRSEVEQQLTHVRAGEQAALQTEVRITHASGRQRWLALRARVAERTPDGRARWLIGSVGDITARRRFEESLRRERDLLDAVIGTSVTALVVQNPRGALIYANPEAARMLGCSRAQLLTRLRRPTAWRLATLDDTPCPPDAHPFRQVLGSGSPITGARYRITALDGRVLSVSVNSAPTRDAEGNINRIVSTLDDITERLDAENALRASEGALREVLERLPVAVAVVDADGIVQTCNPAAGEMLGMSLDEVIGRNVFTTRWPMTDEDGEPVLYPSHPIFAAWLDGRPAGDLTLVLQSQGTPEWRWALASAVPRLTAEGRVRDVVLTLTDITPRKQMELSLLQAQKVESIGRLAGGIAHDFNNLLTAVMGSAELMAMDLESDHPVQDDLLRVIDAAERGASLTRQLLAYARKQPIQPRIVDVSRLVTRAVSILERLLGEDVRLHVTPMDDVRVSLDPGQFDQVLINLAVNARDAMPGGGDLYLEVDDRPTLPSAEPLPDAVAVLRVRDSGSGMPPELLPRIFDPFFTTKASGEGTGLGLAVCFGIAKQNGGVINVRSDVERGTTFEVIFPRVGRRQDPSTTIGPRPAPEGFGTILLVEDDAAVRETARRTLSRAGFTVITAPDGARALILIESGPALDGVVTDVVMPAMSGRPLADAIAQNHPHIPILFTSGHADDLLGEHGVIRDGVDFLPKPYSADDLCYRVQRMLSRRPGGSS